MRFRAVTMVPWKLESLIIPAVDTLPAIAPTVVKLTAVIEDLLRCKLLTSASSPNIPTYQYQGFLYRQIIY